MKSKLTALKHWMDTGYYKQNGQTVWDLYLQLLRYWGVMSHDDRKFMDNSKKILLSR